MFIVMEYDAYGKQTFEFDTVEAAKKFIEEAEQSGMTQCSEIFKLVPYDEA